MFFLLWLTFLLLAANAFTGKVGYVSYFASKGRSEELICVRLVLERQVALLALSRLSLPTIMV